MSVNRCQYEQKLIEEINFAFNGFRGGELIQWNERQKNSSRSTENCKRVEEDIINSV
jgi:hypothetical protein